MNLVNYVSLSHFSGRQSRKMLKVTSRLVWMKKPTRLRGESRFSLTVCTYYVSHWSVYDRLFERPDSVRLGMVSWRSEKTGKGSPLTCVSAELHVVRGQSFCKHTWLDLFAGIIGYNINIMPTVKSSSLCFDRLCDYNISRCGMYLSSWTSPRRWRTTTFDLTASPAQRR